MPRFTYSPEMVDFLRTGYRKHRIPELTALFNARFGTDKVITQIKACIKNNKITSSRKVGFAPGENIKLLTPEQVAFVRAQYKKMSRKDLTAALNAKFDLSLTVRQIVSFVKNHKISSGRTGFFEKGQESWNKGKKGYMGPNRTSFKKGQRPKNYRPVGSERICKKDGYVLVKVSERNPFNDNPSGWYRHKHVVLWEQHNGPVPEGFCIRFKDGDKMNIAIDNLIMVSRAEHARLTLMKYGEQPDEVKPVLIGIAKLEQAVFEKRREQ